MRPDTLVCFTDLAVAEKKVGLLRQAQHDRRMLNHFKRRTVRHFDKLSAGPEALEG